MAGSITIDLHMGEMRHVWCDRCLTNAGVEIDVMTLSGSGVSVVTTIKRCARCDQSED